MKWLQRFNKGQTIVDVSLKTNMVLNHTGVLVMLEHHAAFLLRRVSDNFGLVLRLKLILKLVMAE